MHRSKVRVSFIVRDSVDGTYELGKAHAYVQPDLFIYALIDIGI